MSEPKNLYDVLGLPQEWRHPAGDTEVDRLRAENQALKAALDKTTALLKRLSWACWNLDNREELPDEIGGDLYSELLDYMPGSDDFEKEAQNG